MKPADFIQSRPYLFWSAGDLTNLSDEMIVEQVLNYGDFSDVNEMIELFGIEKVAAIFARQSSKKRTNFAPAIKHYFTLYFQKYAPRNLVR